MIETELKINSPEGREISLLSVTPEADSEAEQPKTVLIIGVFHGDEPDGEYLINRYLQEIANNSAAQNEPQKAQNEIKNRLLLIPCLNPDGKAQNKRTNSNGVDLNRNFPCKNWEISEQNEFFGGKAPASEVETRFIVYIIEKYKPDAILTLHEPYRVVNYDGKENAKELAQKVSEINGYKVEENIGYPTPGSFGTYCGVERGIPTITLELPENENKEVLWAANKAVFKLFEFEG